MNLMNKQRNANTQYKTVGVQWFARVWFPLQISTTVDRNAARKPNRFIVCREAEHRQRIVLHAVIEMEGSARWRTNLRRRLTGGGAKPPNGALVKS